MRRCFRLFAVAVGLSLSGCSLAARVVYAPSTRCGALCQKYFNPMSSAAEDERGVCTCWAPYQSYERSPRPTTARIYVETRPLVALANGAR
jgi:hypothetical protein